jgi:tRNA (guanine-N7-)-methyltransferase
MRLKYKAWARPFIEQHSSIFYKQEEIIYHIKQLNKKQDSIFLEIGVGKGDFITELASRYPKLYFVGVEKALTPIAIAGKKIIEQDRDNIKLLFGDVSLLLSSLKKNSINGIFLNFPDPWPKKRHEKRRLTYFKMLNQYRRILSDDGKLIIKTDNLAMFEYSCDNLLKYRYNIINIDMNYMGNDDFDAKSEYEKNFRQQNLPIYRIIAQSLGEQDETK